MADVAGWVVQHGSILAMDKHLDADPCMNHKFIEQREQLRIMKEENPMMRIGKTSALFNREEVTVHEERRQGVKQPKKKFMTTEAYTRRFGKAPDQAKLKSLVVHGIEHRGVVVIDEDDKGIFEYVDETVNSVQRVTALSDPDVILSADQNTNIFNSAMKQMSGATPKEDACLEIPSSSRGRSSVMDGIAPSVSADEDGQAWTITCFDFQIAVASCKLG